MCIRDRLEAGRPVRDATIPDALHRRKSATSASWCGHAIPSTRYRSTQMCIRDRARGTSLFLLSPLDWALIESWKNSGVPLAAVLRGIDIAFEKWRAKRSRMQLVNSLAFCAQPVMLEAQRMADALSLIHI